MNHTITYDIFELAKDLEKAGIAKEGIEAIVKFEKAKDEANLNALATKDDILLIRKDMAIVKRDIILFNNFTFSLSPANLPKVILEVSYDLISTP
jgi:hypothetical protein